MKSTKILVLLLSILLCSCMQSLKEKQRFFGEFDLSSGEYKLLFWGSEGERIDDFDRFYIDDIAALESIQKRWVFTHKKEAMPCGYGYRVMFVNEDSILNQKSLNIECEYIGNWTHFPRGYLADYKEHFVRMTEEESKRFSLKYHSRK